MFKKAFTLAEILIVLTVIGILTAILMPIAIQSAPDENVLKFKKANATLGTVIRELVNSDKYYCDGDLGLMSDCSTKILNYTYASGLNTGEYFCKTIADVVSAKKVSCKTLENAHSAVVLTSNEDFWSLARDGNKMKRTVNASTIAGAKDTLDKFCKKAAIIVGEEIVTQDGVTWYGGGSAHHGSCDNGSGKTKLRYFSPPGEFPANYSDQLGFDIAYKVYCIDIDGIPSNATEDNCVNECPFGYGIRADGKILTGKRADEWIEKSIQRGDE